jgi:hypothetical protein
MNSRFELYLPHQNIMKREVFLSKKSSRNRVGSWLKHKEIEMQPYVSLTLLKKSR